MVTQPMKLHARAGTLSVAPHLVPELQLRDPPETAHPWAFYPAITGGAGLWIRPLAHAQGKRGNAPVAEFRQTRGFPQPGPARRRGGG